MAVLMAKREKVQVAYSDYQHLSTDNLSFVAGLRRRPVPAPSPEANVSSGPRRPRLPISKEEGDKDIGKAEESARLETQTVKQACPSRSCAPRNEKLESMVEKRVAALAARHKTQSKLAVLAEKTQNAENKLEDAKTELIRTTKSIAEGEERMETLRDALREGVTINKACAEDLDSRLKDAMALRRALAADTLPPHSAVISPAAEEYNDGRTLQPPQPRSWQRGKHDSSHRGVARTTWVHSGQLGPTRVFASSSKSSAPWENCQSLSSRQGASDSEAISVGGMVHPSVCAPTPLVGAEVEPTVHPGDGTDQDAWSCCGRTISSAGSGCEPKEPSPTPVDLLLDVLDPRSGLGQRLDFRDLLPRIAWTGLSTSPLHLFARSCSDGTLRPNTAPERLPASGKHRRPREARHVGFAVGPEDIVFAGATVRASSGQSTRRAFAGRDRSPTDSGVCGRDQEHVQRPSSSVDRKETTGRRRNRACGRGSASTTCHEVGKEDRDGGHAEEFLPKTQILGLNGIKFPREVRQVGLGRPLTAPAVKVGCQLVRVSVVRGAVESAVM